MKFFGSACGLAFLSVLLRLAGTDWTTSGVSALFLYLAFSIPSAFEAAAGFAAGYRPKLMLGFLSLRFTNYGPAKRPFHLVICSCARLAGFAALLAGVPLFTGHVTVFVAFYAAAGLLANLVPIGRLSAGNTALAIIWARSDDYPAAQAHVHSVRWPALLLALSAAFYITAQGLSFGVGILIVVSTAFWSSRRDTGTATPSTSDRVSVDDVGVPLSTLNAELIILKRSRAVLDIPVIGRVNAAVLPSGTLLMDGLLAHPHHEWFVVRRARGDCLVIGKAQLRHAASMPSL